ncbi:response regulator [Flavobacterium sp. 3HN19-14]|uniref:response regulator n=1 Tax=Flavobacterium sp. 3HN19-14 TaxID=3448133 RepID=UPI003EDF14F6
MPDSGHNRNTFVRCRTSKIKLLIADDHQLFISGLKLILKDYVDIGTPDHALNGKEAIDKCRHEKYDIILMDINMPMIDGIEATKEIKRHCADTKILIVSMLSDLETVAKVLKAGADGFLIKNADASEFVKAFQVMRRDEVYLSPVLSELFTRDRAGKTIIKNDYIQFTENIVTPREKSILKMIAEGHTNQVIADTLSLSVKTVDTHRNNMLAKLNLPNTAALVRFAIDNKLV